MNVSVSRRQHAVSYVEKIIHNEFKQLQERIHDETPKGVAIKESDQELLDFTGKVLKYNLNLLVSEIMTTHSDLYLSELLIFVSDVELHTLDLEPRPKFDRSIRELPARPTILLDKKLPRHTLRDSITSYNRYIN
tara:strand:+ start:2970 stop:3374 length:405 start_codon:yes stop_codon:yes gene_type:complete